MMKPSAERLIAAGFVLALAILGGIAVLAEHNGHQAAHHVAAVAVLFVGFAIARALLDVRALRRAEAGLRAAEQRQRELNAALERRNARLQEASVELEQARDQAQSADSLKSNFLAAMGHELRTPLNSIIGFTGVLLQGLPGPLSDEQRKQLGIVRDSGRHLLALINDVLDLSRIEARRMEVAHEPFDLRDTIGRVVDALRPPAGMKGIALDARIAEGVGAMTGDARRVEQVLLKLVGNAVKFTERGGVSVVAECIDWRHPREAGSRAAVRIEVRDAGQGIREEDLPRLFLPFEQLGAGPARPHEGTGLGLAISRRLATLMQGTLEVASRWQHGSVFTLTLPVQPVSDP